MLMSAAITQAYYTALGNKDILTAASYLQDGVHFVSPLTELQSKE